MKNAFIFFLLLISLLCSGQDKQEPGSNDLDSNFTPISNSIFNRSHKKGADGSFSNVTFKNVVKFCPSALAWKKVLFFYERELSRGFSLNVGVGMSFGDDVFQKKYFGWNTYGVDLAEYTLDLTTSELLENCNYLKSTPYFYAGLRYYVNSTAFEGWYAEFATRYQRVEYRVDNTIGSIDLEGPNSAFFETYAATFGWGYTVLTGSKKRFGHDFYANFGFKYIEHTHFAVVQHWDSRGFWLPMTYVKTNSEDTRILFPAINIGYCFWFGF
ncbi:MAG: hypothetical protein V4635_07045 [Bacteroidota bacterium]